MTNVARQLVPATSVDVIDACLSRDRWQLAQLNPSRGCVRLIAGVFQMNHSEGCPTPHLVANRIRWSIGGRATDAAGV